MRDFIIDCYECKGTGKYEDGEFSCDCSTCKGSGKIIEEVDIKEDDIANIRYLKEICAKYKNRHRNNYTLNVRYVLYEIVIPMLFDILERIKKNEFI